MRNKILFTLICVFVLSGPVLGQAIELDRDSFHVVGQGGSHLGIQLRDVRNEDVSRLKLQTERGVLVEKVLPDTPAAQAGLLGNDVIVEFDGQPVHSAAQFRRLVRETPPGRTANLAVMRAGQRKSLSVKLQESSRASVIRPDGNFRLEMPSIDLGKIQLPEIGIGRQPSRLGIQVLNLTDQLADYFRVPDKRGVLVASVADGGPAHKSGLKAGDVITAVNGKPVDDTRDLQTEVRRDEAKALKIDYVRNGQKHSAELALEPPNNRPRGEGLRL